MTNLTKRQREVYDAIQAFIRFNGYAPSFEEIKVETGLSSVATVHKHLENLEAKGALKRRRNKGRAIELTGAADFAASTTLPLLGVVAAGVPIEAVEDREEVTVPTELVGRGESFALLVRGDSMIDEQIRDGDTIIVERRETAENGETVVALVDEREATVKKFYKDAGTVRLQPANEAMAPIVLSADRVQIQGIVIGLMRKY